MGPNDTFVFQSDVAAKPIQRTAMAVVLRGRKDKGTIGLCEQLGLQAKVTPHDLRRTASTIAGVLGYRQNEIAPCLDHEDDAAPRATRIYVRSPDFEHKRKILNDVGTGLARIVGDNVVSFAA
jgi:integrase